MLLPAAQSRQDQCDGYQYCRNEIEIGGLETQRIARQSELDGKAVGDGAENTADERNQNAPRAEQRFADDDGRKPDDDGADTGSHIGKAIGLRKKRAAERDQCIRKRHAKIDLVAGLHPLGARHPRIRARRPHGKARVALKETPDENDSEQYQNADKEWPHEIFGKTETVERRDHRILIEQRHIRFSHHPKVHRK